ncbi:MULTISPECIES: YhdH/YhfP family quinone oxidoreductase [Pseudomonas]|uniref:Putative quinone oxidoreductase, YhdH/YhfP family n=1 Tax=Pseudomonas segetis TaxID=298908 RepID=A0A239AA83_9PSED|nr:MULTISPECIES: YhdH/YhfP family quinone oxidoreductase [Pseudomonas]SNR92241.1 putative quinone oxidoreductase, YhdH/YhfP family [Pseudomonas segetis]
MTKFNALIAREKSDGQFEQVVVQRDITDLPAGDLLIRVKYSSVNFKDALSASGSKAVTKHFPHTPGIDAAGVVEHSGVSDFKAGDEVIVTGYDLGMNTAGGLAQYIRIPATWAVKRPQGLSLRESMVLGTAGLTAALCIDKLQSVGTNPESGPILVTGATGGVGTVAVSLLTKLGYSVTASTGKAWQSDFLKALGASEVVLRSELQQGEERPMLKAQWGGAVDTVGGAILCNLVKSLRYGASVAACGLTAGVDMNGTVLPFILRGVNLLGVDSVELPLAVKTAVWNKLANEWKLDTLDNLVTEISLEQVPEALAKLLEGQMVGRVVVAL